MLTRTQRKLFIVSELYYPEETSTGHLLTELAEALADTRSIHVLCAQPTYSKRGHRASKREERNGVTITRCPSTTFDKSRILSRLCNLVTISISMFVVALWRLKPKATVLVVTNPPLLPFLILIACKLKRTRCILLIHDVYPDVFAATGIAHPGSLLYRSVDLAIKWLYAHMNAIVSIGRDMDQRVAIKMGRRKPFRYIIPNWADHKDIQPLVRTGTNEYFCVQYSGNMGRTHALDTIVEAAAHLATEEPTVRFDLIGWGAGRMKLVEEIAAHRLLNIRVRDFVPRNQLSDSINECDVALIAFKPGMAGISVPCRMYNIMAAGKPIIAVTDAESELALTILENRIGWVVPPNNPEALASAILEAKSNLPLLEVMGSRARRAVEERYTLAHVADQYRSLLSDLDKSTIPE